MLKYGVEICEGLERAHKSGVVHRDLKPANVMLTKTGAKLMDFGLAKATPTGPAPISSLSMTMSHPSADHPLTAQGTIMGTFQYMSPEQTEGKEADARSDIFAMGALLYEMVTGKRAFTGKSQASVVAAILASEPPPISTVQPMTPPALVQVVKTCLGKDPEERFQTVHDLKLQLKWIAEASASQLAAPAQVRARRVVQKRTLMTAAAVGWILAAAALAIFFYTRAQLEDARRPMTASWLAPTDKEFSTVAASAPALSPDGSKLAFLTGGTRDLELWVREVTTGTARKLEGIEQASFPFWSPDGKFIGFFSAGKLKKVALAGGPVQILCDAPEGRGASWSQRGVIIFTPNIFRTIYKVAEEAERPRGLPWHRRVGHMPQSIFFFPTAIISCSLHATRARPHKPPRVRSMEHRSPARKRDRYWSAPPMCSIRRDTSCTCVKACWWRSASIRNRCNSAAILSLWPKNSIIGTRAISPPSPPRMARLCTATDRRRRLSLCGWTARAKSWDNLASPAFMGYRSLPPTAPWSESCAEIPTQAEATFGSSTPDGHDVAQHIRRRINLTYVFSQTRRNCRLHPCGDGHGRNVDSADQWLGQSGEVGDASNRLCAVKLV